MALGDFGARDAGVLGVGGAGVGARDVRVRVVGAQGVGGAGVDDARARSRHFRFDARGAHEDAHDYARDLHLILFSV